jgi:hypothetical protein
MQIEEESDAAAPNLPIGPDHEMVPVTKEVMMKEHPICQ